MLYVYVSEKEKKLRLVVEEKIQEGGIKVDPTIKQNNRTDVAGIKMLSSLHVKLPVLSTVSLVPIVLLYFL